MRAAVLVAFCLAPVLMAQDEPNVVLVMADDLGWADLGCQGHPVLRTPELDGMAANGLRFTRFYAGAPVCSPTRGSCMTGRHPYRYGIVFANRGHMPKGEVTLAELLRARGYRTGHFGKWHLGTLTKTVKDSNRGGPRGAKHYSPPWQNGFDVCFSTEAKVPTFNPMLKPGSDEPFGTYYWNEQGARVTDNLDGDDSRVIMDRVVPFVRASVAKQRAFFAVVWFHTPHRPLVASAEDRAPYADFPERTQHYYGAIRAMDQQVGRLRRELRELGVAKNTMLWFCSDNGPEGRKGKAPGSAGVLRGRKRSLYEGGVRVPGILEWPARIAKARVIDVPAVTSDFLPTVCAVLGIALPEDRAIDGISLLPWIDGATRPRAHPIGFESGKQVAWIGDRYKLVGRGKAFELYDLVADPRELNDLFDADDERCKRMVAALGAWRASRNDG